MSSSANIHFKKGLKTGFLPVFSALLTYTLLDQTLNKQIEAAIQSPNGLSNTIWVWAALSLSSALFFPLFISLLCSYALAKPSQSSARFLRSKLEHGMIETMRSWGKLILWFFVFIIPIFWKYLHYFLTPFVVMFSKRYERGEVDALEYSTELSKKVFWRLQLWLAIFYFIIPALVSILLDEKRVFIISPVTATLCVALETVILFAYHYFVLKLFLPYLNEMENPPSVMTEDQEPHVPHV